MSQTLEVLDPVAPWPTQGATAAVAALSTLNGRTVGFIDNSKPNFSFLVDDLARLLTTRHGVARIVRHRKTSASIGAAREVIADLARECDLVVTGSGD
ncbi:MAG: hypothetical protein H7125_00370 [Proteobacteria bacterium]|nr:hypothetical protein [Burkholderiales bacterium]